MHAEIVMIGTELLLGEIVDTNATLLAKRLRDIGLDLYYKTTVGDNEARITQVLNRSLDRAEVIITSGGLGPTVDDVTRQAVANATGRKLVYSTELEQQIAERFRSFGREMKENNKRQAYIPEGAMPLRNPVGTAPCFLSEDVSGRGFIISLPGVPRELEHMMDHVVMPLLIERVGGTQVLKTRILRTCAVGESNVDGVIADLMTERNPTVGLAAHVGQTDVRITAKALTEAEAEALIEPMEAEIRERLGVAIYGVGQETVPEVVGRLLAEKDLSLAVLDTLTEGELAQYLAEADFGHLLAADLHPADLEEAVAAVDLPVEGPADQADGPALAKVMARAIAPAEGVSVVLVGPLADGKAYIAVHGPGEGHLVRPAHNVKRETDYRRRWLIIQALDWVRRAVLGELTSPADWD
jgi:nicotinamide-nucleotide amidase